MHAGNKGQLIFFFSSLGSGFQTSRKGSDEDAELNVDGDDTEEYGKPQYPFKLPDNSVFHFLFLLSFSFLHPHLLVFQV